MRNYLIIDGVSSLDYGLFISGKGAYSSPAKRYEEVDIPGRNGKLLLDTENYFDNVDVSYDAFMYEDPDGAYTKLNYQEALEYRTLRERLGALRAFLGSREGYFRLEDTYHTDEYRMAYYVDDISPEMSDNLHLASFTLKFVCKPQRFLKSGENVLTLTSGLSLYNPTNFKSSPLIRAYGTGSFTVSGVKMTINSANIYTDIDCDLMECYKGSTNCNNNVVLNNSVFPSLTPKENVISMSGITKLEITPRWWTL